jgi:drug/metabolite transporter (DMT)-like permease
MPPPVDSTRTPRDSQVGVPPRVSLTDLMLLIMSVIWGVNYSVMKFGTEVLDPLAFNGVRISLAALALALAAALVRAARPRSRDVMTLLALGVLGNGMYQTFFIQGIARTRAGTAALVLAATPALVALIGRLLRVEQTSVRGAAGIAISMAGVALVVFGRSSADAGEATLLGNLLVLIGAWCWSLFTVLLKPYAHRLHGVHVAAFTMLGGAVPLLLLAAPAIAATDWRLVAAPAWAAVAFSGLGGLVVGYLFWNRGVRVLGPTRTAMYANVQPVIALLAAWVTLGEVPTAWQGIGTGTIVAGVLMTRQ